MKNTFKFLCMLSAYFCYGQCPSNVVITTNNYSVGLTESSTYIKISSSVSSSASVKLDADPDNGYVLMNPGFFASPSNGRVFIAQPLDGCGSGIPSKNGDENDEVQNEVSGDYAINFYPNPTNGKFTINSNQSISGKLNIYDVNLILIYSSDFSDSNSLNIDISNYPNGIYLTEISTIEYPTKTFRIIKN